MMNKTKKESKAIAEKPAIQAGEASELALEQYAEMTDEIGIKLDEADAAARNSSERYTAEEVFSRVREHLKRGNGS